MTSKLGVTLLYSIPICVSTASAPSILPFYRAVKSEIPDSLYTLPLGPRLVRMRESRGLSQAELARRAELCPSFVCQLESGKRKGRNPETLMKLATALGVDMVQILGLK